MNINKLFFVILIVFISCEKKETTTSNEDSKYIKYAKKFDIKENETNYLLTIYSPFPDSDLKFEYIINKASFANSTGINTPINKIVVTSTTNISMVELLGKENTLVGFPHTDFISSTKTRKRVDTGEIQEIGVDENLNTEVVLSIKPEAIIAYSMNPGNKSLATLERLGIPVLYNGAWLEKSPLGRAEWIKVFGILFDQKEKADQIFNQIEENYNTAKAIAKTEIKKPTAVSGALFNSSWFLPAGDSYVAQLYRDANIDYLWNTSEGTGSLSLNYENVLLKAKEAQLWLDPGYFSNKKDLIQGSELHDNFDAFKNDNIYTFTNKKGPTGGIIYYEQGPTRPDLVLKDLIKISHPELLTDYQLTFYEKMK